MNQNSLFSIEPDQGGLNILAKDGSVHYHPEFISAADSAKLIDKLKVSLQWEVDQLIMFGKLVSTRRKIAWISELYLYLLWSEQATSSMDPRTTTHKKSARETF